MHAVRVFLPKCWFDAEKCARGIDVLKLYRAGYDGKLQTLRPHPHLRKRLGGAFRIQWDDPTVAVDFFERTLSRA